MVKMKVAYQGQKHCELTHEPSKTVIHTDAPKDNFGRGESFSPTDLMGAALCSCILTTMAIIGEKEGIEFTEGHGEVTKIMADNPRRIQALQVHLTLSKNLNPVQRARMETIARTCPVHRGLNPDIEVPIIFTYE